MVDLILGKMIDYFNDDARRINHALKVFGFALNICTLEALLPKDRQVVLLCAILHDIGIKEAERKYKSSDGKYQELEGPAIAKKILEEYGVEKEIIDRVCFIIGNHHSYQRIDGKDFQILVEADFLVNIYEDDMDKSVVNSLLSKIFKTNSGIKLLNNMYL